MGLIMSVPDLRYYQQELAALNARMAQLQRDGYAISPQMSEDHCTLAYAVKVLSDPLPEELG